MHRAHKRLISVLRVHVKGSCDRIPYRARRSDRVQAGNVNDQIPLVERRTQRCDVALYHVEVMTLFLGRQGHLHGLRAIVVELDPRKDIFRFVN